MIVLDGFEKRLRIAMEAMEFKQADIVERTGLSKALVSAYVLGKNRPREAQLKKIADALCVDAGWLAGNIPYNERGYDRQQELIQIFGQLDERDKNTILALARDMLERMRARETAEA